MVLGAIESNPANEELRRVYAKAMPDLKKILASHEGVSQPLFLSVPEGYWQATVRLMIVGQQTNSWGRIDDGLDELLDKYQAFYRDRRYKNSPFWQSSEKLFRLLNPSMVGNAFLWSNLVKVDQHRKRPRGDLEEDVSRLGLLTAELWLLMPQVVVFFTGPSYDDRLGQTFKGIIHRKICSGVDALEHSDLPAKSFRTYHPKYLRIAKKTNVIDEIIHAI